MATEHEEKLGTEDSKWLGEYSQVHMNVFGTPLRVMDHGQGAHIWDVDGNEYLDFLAGIAVNSLGYAHPKWVKAVADQAAKVAHISNYFASEPQIELASKLVKLAGAPEGSKVYFGNSGAEGNEAALKLAKLYGRTLPGALPSIGGKPARIACRRLHDHPVVQDHAGLHGQQQHREQDRDEERRFHSRLPALACAQNAQSPPPCESES